MKKSLIAILLTGFALTSLTYSQVSETLVNENKVWSNLWETASGGPPPHEMRTTFIKFQGDTLIDNVLYKRVLASTDANQLTFSVIGGIREDTSHKVFFRQLNDAAEALLYDFNAMPGDTMLIKGFTLVVETVDSVLIDNKFLKRMVLSDHGCIGETWIESMGSLCGVLESGYYFILGTVHNLLCFYENGNLIYTNPNFSHCYYNTVGMGEIPTKKVDVRVFPNPVVSSSVLRIEGPIHQDFFVEIYTLNGRKLKTLRTKDLLINLNRKDYLPGIYIYNIPQSQSESYTGKFIIK